MHGTILLVADRDPLREGVAALLAEEGYRVVTADVKEALTVLGQTRPDLVLLDVGAAAPGDWRLLERMRRRGAAPVVLLADRPVAPAEAALRGAAGALTKPCGLGELLTMVAQQLTPGARAA